MMVACHNFDLDVVRNAGYRICFVCRPMNGDRPVRSDTQSRERFSRTGNVPLGGYRMRLPTVEMYCSVCSNIAEIEWIEIAPTA
jgi:hypothetical protein